jgi:hypothetical protein
MIAAPYTKLMVANITVNQAAAVIVTSLAKARAAGLDDGRLIFVHDGFYANEPRDYLARDTYRHCVARDVVLDHALQSGSQAPDFTELYSCFPVVPKAARRRLGLSQDAAITVTGGLTFFGAPLNNYMTHATCAMVRRLRDYAGTGLLYGQGGFMTKHHALRMGTAPAPRPQGAGVIDVQSEVRSRYGHVPQFEPEPTGQGEIETHTVLYDRDGQRMGVAVVRMADGARSLAWICADDLAMFEDPHAYAIGRIGDVRIDQDGRPRWRAK